MKKFAFKTLSVLLAAVLLVVALPIAAFAEDVSPCAVLICEKHMYGLAYEEVVGAERIDNDESSLEYHYQVVHRHYACVTCGWEGEVEVVRYLEEHNEVQIGAGVTQCTDCYTIFLH